MCPEEPATILLQTLAAEVLDDFSCVFGVIVKLVNECGIIQMPPWWNCMMNKILPVLPSSVGAINQIHFDQITNSICRNAAQTSREPPPCFTTECRH